MLIKPDDLTITRDTLRGELLKVKKGIGSADAAICTEHNIKGKRFAWHTADLPLQLRIVLHPESEKLSRTMAHSWAAFIRTGNPSTNELQWPKFSAARRETMVFDDTTGIQYDPFREIREALDYRNGH
ncbi:MAG: carboxylesterase family protein [Treponema sp.]|jgi:carboxylesterase type B|nr:carboxylesterase family protein [Treponema sp.]